MVTPNLRAAAASVRTSPGDSGDAATARTSSQDLSPGRPALRGGPVSDRRLFGLARRNAQTSLRSAESDLEEKPRRAPRKRRTPLDARLRTRLLLDARRGIKTTRAAADASAAAWLDSSCRPTSRSAARSAENCASGSAQASGSGTRPHAAATTGSRRSASDGWHRWAWVSCSRTVRSSSSLVSQTRRAFSKGFFASLKRS